MSKLDDVLHTIEDEVAQNGLPGTDERLASKQAIKELMLGIVDNTEVLGPLHPQLSIYRDTLKSEINSL